MVGFPVLTNPHFNGVPEPVTEFMVQVSERSDGHNSLRREFLGDCAPVASQMKPTF